MVPINGVHGSQIWIRGISHRFDKSLISVADSYHILKLGDGWNAPEWVAGIEWNMQEALYSP
jgi:hypothetical protein